MPTIESESQAPLKRPAYFASKIAALAGAILLIFGVLALDFIPKRIISNSRAQGIRIDSSDVELAWVGRGLDLIALGGVLLLGAAAAYLYRR